MKKLKFLIIFFTLTAFENSIYSAEFLKKGVQFIKDIPKEIVTNKKLQRDLLKTAAYLIPVAILYLQISKLSKAQPVEKIIHIYHNSDYDPGYSTHRGRGDT